MALPSTISADSEREERRLLDRLLAVYDAQRKLYDEVLELSQRQCELIRSGAPLPDIREILIAKKACLETVSRLDSGATPWRQAWRANRSAWSAEGRSQLHQVLSEIGLAIENILACEEENDRALLQHCR
ncbi:MAG: hypothetical protein RBT60_11080 [Candidatus Krumholzibacteria bacterium]|jgi:hypothetical protein|nr:hypothetical protein [Candidatus Krumholzibacteria bacterium]